MLPPNIFWLFWWWMDLRIRINLFAPTVDNPAWMLDSTLTNHRNATKMKGMFRSRISWRNVSMLIGYSGCQMSSWRSDKGATPREVTLVGAAAGRGNTGKLFCLFPCSKFELQTLHKISDGREGEGGRSSPCCARRSTQCAPSWWLWRWNRGVGVTIHFQNVFF